MRLILLLMLPACAVSGLTGVSRISAQSPLGSQITIVGTVLDSNGAPPPASSSVALVLAGTSGPSSSARSCASGSLDEAGRFQLRLLPLAAGCATAGAALQLQVNGVPAQPLFTVPPFPGAYIVNFMVGAPLGAQPPAVASGPATTPLPPGCSQVVVALGAGATPSGLAGHLANQGALIAIWHYDNAQQRFRAYFTDPSAPSDLMSLTPIDSVFVCVSRATSITVP